jgi:hypothetical protein
MLRRFRQARQWIFGILPGFERFAEPFFVINHNNSQFKAKLYTGTKKDGRTAADTEKDIKKEASPDRPHFHSQSGLTSPCSWYLTSWLPLFL